MRNLISGQGLGAPWSAAATNQAYLPLKVSVAYLLGTFAIFLFGPNRALAENVPGLVVFVLSTVAFFSAGYRLSVVQSRNYRKFGSSDREVTPYTKAAILLGAGWFLLFSLASLAEYGATGLGDILSAALSPSDSYYAKFTVYAEQQSTGRVNLPIQIAVLTGAFYGVLVPLTVYYWRRLGVPTRILALLGILAYAGYFVYIGTQKGIGDLLVMAVAALAISTVSLDKPGQAGSGVRSRESTRHRGSRRSWRGMTVAVAVVALGIGFFGYLANNQANRIEGSSFAAQFSPSPLLSSVFGEKYARGLLVAVYYPTHGYIGLSKNLGVPFEWSQGFGGMPALASYKTQYLGGADPIELSYPSRTEAITGWPAGKLWATVYPWLASDLSFPGAAVFMAGAGWFMARMWLGARVERDALSLVLFCQAAIFIAYVPANNQLMTSRYTAVGLVTLLAVYVARSLVGGRRPRLTAPWRERSPRFTRSSAERAPAADHSTVWGPPPN